MKHYHTAECLNTRTGICFNVFWCQLLSASTLYTNVTKWLFPAAQTFYLLVLLCMDLELSSPFNGFYDLARELQV